MNIGYLQAWLCGVLPPVGVVAALAHLLGRCPRRALQAAVPALAVVGWVFLIDLLYGPVLPHREERAVAFRFLLWGGVLLLPLGLVWPLRRFRWPAGRAVPGPVLRRRLGIAFGLASVGSFFGSSRITVAHLRRFAQ